jgi:prepilin-type N-terminal cleavage/methylation domain-containing protein
MNRSELIRYPFETAAGYRPLRGSKGSRPGRLEKVAGFTLVELMVSLAVLTIAIFGLLAAQLFCVMLDDATKETNIALNALRLKVDEIRSHDFISLPACYRTNPAPFHAGHSDNFEVIGLTPQTNDLDGMVGKVVIEQPPVDQYSSIYVRVEISWQGRDGTNRGIQVRNVISARRYKD